MLTPQFSSSPETYSLHVGASLDVDGVTNMVVGQVGRQVQGTVVLEPAAELVAGVVAQTSGATHLMPAAHAPISPPGSYPHAPRFHRPHRPPKPPPSGDRWDDDDPCHAIGSPKPHHPVQPKPASAVTAPTVPLRRPRYLLSLCSQKRTWEERGCLKNAGFAACGLGYYAPIGERRIRTTIEI